MSGCIFIAHNEMRSSIFGAQSTCEKYPIQINVFLHSGPDTPIKRYFSKAGGDGERRKEKGRRKVLFSKQLQQAWDLHKGVTELFHGNRMLFGAEKHLREIFFLFYFACCLEKGED